MYAAVLKILVPIGCGFLLRALRLLKKEDAEILNRFVIYFTVPQLIFYSMYQSKFPGFGQLFLICLSLILLTLLFYFLGKFSNLFLKLKGARATSFLLCVAFGNYGWLGWPVAKSFFGLEGLNRAFIFTLLWWPVFYIVGLKIGLGREKGASLRMRDKRKVLTLTMLSFSSMGLGVGFNLAGIGMPAWILEIVRSFGDMTVPLILVSIGLVLSAQRIRGLLYLALVVSGLRLALGPMFGYGVSRLLPLDVLSQKVVLLEAGMPVATMIPALNEYFEIDMELVSIVILISTLLSLVSIPILASFLL